MTEEEELNQRFVRTTERRLREALTRQATPEVRRLRDNARFFLQPAISDRDTIVLTDENQELKAVPADRFVIDYEVKR